MIELYLPERFAGFTEVSEDPGNRRHVVIEAFEVTQSYHITPDRDRIWTRWFVPPKPKVELPDVRPGGVIAYTDVDGVRRRLMRGDNGWFDQDSRWSDEAVLADVNENGFTVELLGL
jgi:hypothetical protein